MSLLEQIRDEAVDSNSDLGALLRKCKVLAARLKSAELEQWLVWESNGYPDDAAVPDYRKWSLDMRGRFASSRMLMNDAQVPLHTLPERARKNFAEYACRASVSTVEAGRRGAKSSQYRVSCELASILDEVYVGYRCLEVWGIFGVANFEELLNAVRNRVLDFALALEKEGIAVTDDVKPTDAAPERVTQIFNTTVYGTQGGAVVVGSANTVSVGPDLSKALMELRALVAADSRAGENATADTLADIDTIRAQVAKSKPDEGIIKTAWEAVKISATAQEATPLLAKCAALLFGGPAP